MTDKLMKAETGSHIPPGFAATLTVPPAPPLPGHGESREPSPSLSLWACTGDDHLAEIILQGNRR